MGSQYSIPFSVIWSHCQAYKRYCLLFTELQRFHACTINSYTLRKSMLHTSKIISLLVHTSVAVSYNKGMEVYFLCSPLYRYFVRYLQENEGQSKKDLESTLEYVHFMQSSHHEYIEGLMITSVMSKSHDGKK